MRALSRAAVRRSRAPLRTRTPAGEPATYRHLAHVVRAALRLFTREERDAAAQLPRAGHPVIVAANHVSYVDVVAVGRYLIWSGRWPRYLGKAELWKAFLIGWLAAAAVRSEERNTVRAKDALVHARAALERGECIVICSQGGCTHDPDSAPAGTHRCRAAGAGHRRAGLSRSPTGAPTASCRAARSPSRPGQRIQIVMATQVLSRREAEVAL